MRTQPDLEVMSHAVALRYTAAMSAAAAATRTSLEQTVATMRRHRIGPAAVGHLDRARDEAGLLAEQLHAAEAVLRGHDVVREAYAAAPDAGDKTWMTDATGAPVAGDAAASPGQSPGAASPGAPADVPAGAETDPYGERGDDGTYGGMWWPTSPDVDGPYLDWSSTLPGTGRRHAEVGDGDQAVVLTLTPSDLLDLRDKLARCFGPHPRPDDDVLYPDDDGNDRAYLDWSVQRADGSRELEAGDGDQAVTLTLSRADLQALHDRLTADCVADPLLALGHATTPGRLQLAGGARVDWRTPSPDGGRVLTVDDGDDSVGVDLAVDEIHRLCDHLDRSLQPGATADDAGLYLDDGRYLDWSSARTGGGRQFEVGDDTGAALVGLTEAQLQALRDQLAADLEGPTGATAVQGSAASD